MSLGDLLHGSPKPAQLHPQLRRDCKCAASRLWDPYRTVNSRIGGAAIPSNEELRSCIRPNGLTFSREARAETYDTPNRCAPPVGWSVLIAQGVSFILFRFRHSLQAMPRMNWTRSIARVFPAKDRDADAVRSLIITRLREKEIPHARRQMDY